MVAPSTLQDATSGSHGNSPLQVVQDDDKDDYEPTQFYTNSNGYEQPDDELHCLEMTVDGKLQERLSSTNWSLKLVAMPPPTLFSRTREGRAPIAWSSKSMISCG